MPDDQTITDYMSTAEAARFLGVDPSRVRQMITEGVLVAQQWDGRTWMVRRESVEAWQRIMASRKKPGPKKGEANE